MRHPELDEASIIAAWEGAVLSTPRIGRDVDEYVSVGFDGNGRLIEMVGVRGNMDDWLIYHAMTPPSEKTYTELGIKR